MKSIIKFFGHKKNRHNCNEIVSKLEELIDGEVDEATEQRLIEEIKRCPACLKHYDLDVAFKDFLQKKLERKPCAEKIKSQILDRIRAIDI